MGACLPVLYDTRSSVHVDANGESDCQGHELSKLPTNGSGNFYLVTGGTRGDQQPMVMIGKKLKAMGYSITLCVGPEGKAWATDNGFNFIEFDSMEDVVRNNDGVRASAETGNFQDFMTALSTHVTKALPRELDQLWAAMKDDKDAVGLLMTSTHSAIGEAISRKKGGMYVGAMYMFPLSPTKDFAPFNVDPRNKETWQALGPPFDGFEEWPGGDMNVAMWTGMLNKLSEDWYGTSEAATKAVGAEDLMPDTKEGFAKLLGSAWFMPPRNPKDLTVWTIDTIFAYDSFILGDGPSDFTHVQKKAQVGYVFDTEEAGTSMSLFDDELKAFLKKGDEPVYFGWGSMCREKNDELVRAAVSAAKITGKRAIILYGWAHLSLDLLDKEKDADLLKYAEDNVIFVKDVSHIKLFPECCCVVTHGGSGTAAAMIRGGRPGIVTPVWWDQIFFGDRLEAIGMGKRGPHFSKITGENLAELIKEVTTETYIKKARAARKELLSRTSGDEAVALRCHREIMARKG